MEHVRRRLLDRAISIQIVIICCAFGMITTAEFKCYDCASLLNPDSSCQGEPSVSSSTKCKTYCYTDVITQAGVRSYMKRGCATELECTEGSTCRELSRTGSCRSCCQSALCNDDSPDDLDFAAKDDNNGASMAAGGALLVILGVVHGVGYIL